MGRAWWETLIRQLVFNANEVILTIALRHHSPPSETFHKLCQVTLCLLQSWQKYWYSFQKQFVGCAHYNVPIMMYLVMNPLMLPCFIYNLVHVINPTMHFGWHTSSCSSIHPLSWKAWQFDIFYPTYPITLKSNLMWDLYACLQIDYVLLMLLKLELDGARTKMKSKLMSWKCSFNMIWHSSILSLKVAIEASCDFGMSLL
jgi:hypothetical protein